MQARGHRVVVHGAHGSRIVAEAPRFGVPAVALSIGRKRPAGVMRHAPRPPRDAIRHRQHAQLDRHLAHRRGVAPRRPSAARARAHAPRIRPGAERRRHPLALPQGDHAADHDRRSAARHADPRQRHRPRTDRVDPHRHRRTRFAPGDRQAARTARSAWLRNPRIIGIVATLRSWKGHRYLLDAFAAARATAMRASSSSATGRSARRSRRRSTRSHCATASSSPGSRTTLRRGCARSTSSCCRPTRTKASRRRCCRRCSPACHASRPTRAPFPKSRATARPR